MKPVGKPTKGFRDWYEHNGFDGSNFIYYKGAGAKTGYCTSCLKTEQLDVKPKHNMLGKSPVCHRIINYEKKKKKFRVQKRKNDVHVRCRAFYIHPAL